MIPPGLSGRAPRCSRKQRLLHCRLRPDSPQRPRAGRRRSASPGMRSAARRASHTAAPSRSSLTRHVTFRLHLPLQLPPICTDARHLVEHEQHVWRAPGMSVEWAWVTALFCSLPTCGTGPTAGRCPHLARGRCTRTRTSSGRSPGATSRPLTVTSSGSPSTTSPCGLRRPSLRCPPPHLQESSGRSPSPSGRCRAQLVSRLSCQVPGNAPVRGRQSHGLAFAHRKS